MRAKTSPVKSVSVRGLKNTLNPHTKEANTRRNCQDASERSERTQMGVHPGYLKKLISSLTLVRRDTVREAILTVPARNVPQTVGTHS